ncbi:Thioredoxin oxidoreductase [Lysobacter dokdonensis DS-58]|uniref:2-hydroxychromene-2-carboxylate isomerase n=1 Tax=Lysobacter dokdonensis DS-58 TaxID=1300345 RepID=A0A0A2WD16_9GAMM|nr:2-hydroxychromene-2-carboxylate isomerase [Lysobacter dokdonensis]KGQ18061.1 Thioredoxin oxidoreductase [Lysobacter dokdonensis DS-58]
MPAPLRWYFDFLSPFSYLHWQKVKGLRATHAVELVPVVFGAVLSAHGQKGPAEIPGKREFTYRHVLWQARAEGVPMTFPPAHPFNPLGALRACIAAGSTAESVDAIFDWIWRDGRAVDTDAALRPLLDRIGVAPDALAAADTKAALRANTDAAIAAGVYGVPTLRIGDDLFWGNDAHGFALAALHDPTLLEEAAMQRVSTLPVGISRLP